jgi:hypothetical protein
MGVCRVERKRAVSMCGSGLCRGHAVSTNFTYCMRRYCVATVLLLTLCVNNAWTAPTASVSYHGLALEVQQRTQVGPETLQISYEGEVFVIAESEAGRGVALRFLSNQSATLDARIVANLAARAARVPDSEVLGASLKMIFAASVAGHSRERGWSCKGSRCP